MSFYGFDNQDDFNEYRLLKESEDDSDDRTTSRSSDSGEESSYSSYRSSSYRSSGKASKAPLTPEEEKEKLMKDEQARLEKKLQGKKGMDEDTKTGLARLFVIIALCISIAVGYYWKDYSYVVKYALHLYIPPPDFDSYMQMYELENGIEERDESEDMVETVPDDMQSNPQSVPPQSQTSTNGSYRYSNSQYHSSDWDDDDDDDDTWYRGDDDPDEYYEYDYHE